MLKRGKRSICFFLSGCFLFSTLWIFTTFICLASPAQNSRIAQLMAAANAGDPVAQYKLGEAYHGGAEGVPQDNDKADQWFLKSALQGYAPAETKVGGMYIEGGGVVAENHAEGVRWLKKAAAQGDPAAKFGLFLEDLHVYKLRALPQPIKTAILICAMLLPPMLVLVIFVLYLVLCWKLGRKIRDARRR